MITSKDNPTYKSVKALLKKRERDKRGQCLIEGMREILRYPNIQTVLYAEETDEIRDLAEQGIETLAVKPSLLDSLSVREGAPVAVGKKIVFAVDDLTEAKPLLILEGIENPGNLGAILRSVDGSGTAGVILANCKTDEYHPSVVRNSLGIVGSLPIVHTTSEEAMQFLRSANFQIVVTSPDASEIYYQSQFREKVAIVMGSESAGVTALWKKSADLFVKVPMLGKADSLNVSVATALLLYEIKRQSDETSI